MHQRHVLQPKLLPVHLQILLNL